MRLSAFTKKGFTLIELLVTIGIVALLSALVFANYRTGEDQLALQRSANKLAQDIRKTQEMAMAAKLCEKCIPQKVPPGYGIYLAAGNQYLIYADTYPEESNKKYDEGNDQIVETIDLEDKVYIKIVDPPLLSINFEPPDPKVTISGSGFPDASLATITLSLETDSAKEEIIKVNKAGLIYVE